MRDDSMCPRYPALLFWAEDAAAHPLLALSWRVFVIEGVEAH